MIRAWTGQAGYHVITALLIVCVGALTWWLLTADRHDAQTQRAQQAANTLANQLSTDLHAREAAMRRMADRWEAEGGMNGDRFRRDATSYLRDMPGFRAISFADENHVLRHVIPNRTGRALGGNVAAFSEARARTLAEVQATGKAVMTPPVELVDGSGMGMLIFVPVYQDARFNGTLIAVIHLQQWMAQVLSVTANTTLANAPDVALYVDGNPVFASRDWVRTADVSASTTQVLSRQFRVALDVPDPIATWSDQLPLMMAIVLGGMTGLAIVMLRLFRHAQVMEHRANAANTLLSQRNAQLNTEVSERRKAEHTAIRASALKSRFLANMSHEIRTPINAIMGMFELIQAADIPDRQKRQAGVGHDAAQRLFGQLTNVLDLSQLEARTLSFAPSRTTLAAEAAEWAGTLEALVAKSQKPIDGDLQMTEGLPDEISIDRARVGQIVTNLIDNAVKYTVSGKVRVTLRPAREADEKRAPLVISVSDSGCGIPEGERAAVFDRFARGSGEDVRARLGAGLGLSIVQELAELMDLTLLLDATESGGSRFRVVFPPATDISGDAAPPDAASIAASPIPPTAFGTPKIA